MPTLQTQRATIFLPGQLLCRWEISKREGEVGGEGRLHVFTRSAIFLFGQTLMPFP